MRIVLDLQGTQTESRFRGIGRYSMALAQGIVRNCGDHEIIVVLNGLFAESIESIRASFDGLLAQENILVWHIAGPVRECEAGNGWRRKVGELTRESFISGLKADVLCVCSLFEGFIDDAVTSIGGMDSSTPTAVVLYDLIPMLHSAQYLAPYPAYQAYYLRKIEHFKRAQAWLGISRSSCREGIDALALSEDWVVNISTAANSIFQRRNISSEEETSLRSRFDLNRSFVMCVGGGDERKNLKRLICSYARLPHALRSTHQLLVVGKIHEEITLTLKMLANKEGLKPKELMFVSYVEDCDLVKLYNISQLFVFPSWHEGFGLPALEAMACGAPVITSNVSSLPEVVGREDAMFDPFDDAAITAKITRVLTDEKFRQELIDHGVRQAATFSWDKSAMCALKMFEKMYNESKCSKHEKEESTREKQRHLIDMIADIQGGGEVCERDLLSVASAIARNHPDDNKRRLFVDISELVQRDAKSGVQRVVRNILKELIENPPNGYLVEPVYATMQSQGYRYASKFMSRFWDGADCDVEDEFIEPQSGDTFLGLDLQHHIVLYQAPVYTYLRQIGVHVYFVIYDLLPILLPHAFPEGTQPMHARWLGVVAQSDGAICISRAVADELAVWMEDHGPKRLRPFNIGWFHLGADIVNSSPSCGMPDDAEVMLTCLGDRPSFLMVGTIEPRKGHTQTLAAFEQLWSHGVSVNLVIVGKFGWMTDSLQERLCSHPESGKHLFWLKDVSDEYLEKIYDMSTCLIAASEGEGFGLPLIEAAQHGLPIIARDIPVFKEVVGDYACYFSGQHPEPLAIAIEQWLKNHSNGGESCLPDMNWYSWAESAGMLKQVIFDGDWYKRIRGI